MTKKEENLFRCYFIKEKDDKKKSKAIISSTDEKEFFEKFKRKIKEVEKLKKLFNNKKNADNKKRWKFEKFYDYYSKLIKNSDKESKKYLLSNLEAIYKIRKTINKAIDKAAIKKNKEKQEKPNKKNKIKQIEDIFGLIKKKYNGTKTEGWTSVAKFVAWYLGKSQICYYCKSTLQKIVEFHNSKDHGRYNRGILLEVDRKKDKHYTPANCVLACYYCNNAKSDIFAAKEFEDEIGPAIGRVIVKRVNK